MIGYLISLFMAFVLGGGFGAMIVLTKSLNDLNELDGDVRDLAERYEKFVETADAAIDSLDKECKTYKAAVHNAYATLVAIRDRGEDNVDVEEAIGYLGEALE